ncbi:MAG: Fur family transcriptional regulator [Cyanobacteria bacterium P01_F01_bin.150]
MNAKLTRNQRQVYEVLKAAKQELTAQELHQQLRGATKQLGLSTVYRILKTLQLQGKVKARTLGNSEAVYQLIQADHHHLTCLNCGYSVPVKSCPVEALKKELAESQQFQVYYYTLEFFGVCSSCANQLSRKTS